MTYIPVLNELQIGEEAAIGDGAAATIQLVGKTVMLNPRVEAQQVIDLRGTTMPAHQAMILRRWSEGSIDGLADYLTMRNFLDGMFSVDASSPHAYIAVLAGQTPKSHSLYYGQTGLIYKVSGMIGNSLKLSGKSGGSVEMSYGFWGQPCVDGASLGALADPTAILIMGSHCSLYLDPIATAVGTTPLTTLGFAFDATITNDRQPVFHLGSAVPDGNRQGRWGGSLKLTIEANAAMLSYLGDVLDATVTPLGLAARIRMTNGSQILDVDFAGQVIEPPTLIPEDSGVTTVEFTMMPVYNAQAAFLSCWKASLTLP